MNEIEEDILGGIDMAFDWFERNNPNLKVICDKETMSQWYDFVKWCYAQNGEGWAEDQLKKNPRFNFEISPLMKSALSECDAWYCKYAIDHQQTAEDYFGEDEEGHWKALEEAYDKISKSVDTSSFEKLSKISL
ncbi:hypothetical protein N9W70_02060 [Schleiferiaceae bacterium]|nr:hypothetical protein [Schleiferiaceae bacterium]